MYDRFANRVVAWSNMRTFLIALCVFACVAGRAWADIEDVKALLNRGETATAVKQLRSLVRERSPEAEDLLGDFFLTGKGVTQNFSMAANWYQSAAIQGLAQAQFKIGYFREHGIGVPLSRAGAVEMYEFAAAQNHLAAQIRLAAMYFAIDGSNSGRAVSQLATNAERGYQGAVAQLQQMAAKSDPRALKILAELPKAVRYGMGPIPPQSDAAVNKGIAAFMAGDYITALALFNPLTEQGDPGGQFGLGLIYHLGPEIPRDLEKAAEFYRAAAKLGSADAQTNLALLLFHDGGERQDREAAKWLKTAAGIGNDRAIRILAAIESRDHRSLKSIIIAMPDASFALPSGTAETIAEIPGTGVRAFLQGEFETAIAEFKRLADQGNASGLFGLGLVYETGVPSLHNLAKAKLMYRLAAEQGYVAAQVNLASLYLQQDGSREDRAAALAWYRKAASQNDIIAQNILGFLKATERGIPIIDMPASTLLGKAARAGNLQATNTAAVLRVGDPVSRHGNQTGVLKFEVVASSAYAIANTDLATSISVVPAPAGGNPGKRTATFQSFASAAEKGNSRARYNLALVLKSRTPSARDMVHAYKWLGLAMNDGYRPAAKVRQNLAKKMSEAQVIEGEWLIAKALKAKEAPAAEFVDTSGGSADEQRELGIKYQYGKGVPKDYGKAARWYRAAAVKGHAKAQRNLGTMYRLGFGVDGSYEEAARWYRKSAAQGYMKAQRDLGIFYQFGRGVPKDDFEAVRWYRLAAEQGDAKAQANLGFMLKVGRGTKKNLEEAASWYRKAAEQGSSRAQKSLGIMYQFGRGVPQNDKEAVKWYLQSAKQGNAKAQANLGFMFKMGRGVDRDYERAVEWYSKAAEKKSARAQNVLGIMYFEGKGVDRDFTKSARWFRLAFEQNYTKVYAHLGDLIRADPGTSDEYVKLGGLMLKAAKKADSRAHNILGLMYVFGKGVEKDRTAAEKWFRSAVKKGNKEARKNLDALRKNKI